jgi:hypothetical protein
MGKRDLAIGTAFLALLAALGVESAVMQRKATAEAAGVMASGFVFYPLCS